ncbi:MAG: GNAT family N-acetyltransferase [Chitinophagales bacterium]|nr:GNAT family N-acetyltransferase [Hyphomicrobiales bacterium]
MGDELIRIKPADRGDANSLARVHEAAWRSAYQGVIPHLHLRRMIAQRGPSWWARSIRNDGVLTLSFDGAMQGYVSFGQSRLPGAKGEIFELYMAPAFQGVGLGKRLFLAARHELRQRNMACLIVWALEDNATACDFYARLGGTPIRRAHERFGESTLAKIAFRWPA